MTVLRLALSELKRMTSGILPKLSLIALILVPLLYGAVYLYANWDPYSNLDQLKAAVVVNDQGSVVDGKPVKVGDEVAQNLVDSKTFDWVKVSSDQEADDGVANGTYSFALKIPQEFSANLASPSNFDSAQQAILQVTTNDANGYILSSIVDKVTAQVHDSVALQVGETTANQLLTGYGTVHAQIVKAADGASQLASGASQLHNGTAKLHQGSTELQSGANELASGQKQLADGASQLSAGASELSSGLNQLQSKTAGLPGSAQQLSAGAAQVAAGNASLNTKVQSAVGSLDQLSTQATTAVGSVLDKLETDGVITAAQRSSIGSALQTDVNGVKSKIDADAADIQKLAAGSKSVADGAATLAASTPALSSAINQANGGASQLASGAATLSSSEQQAVAGTDKLAAGAKTLDEGVGTLDSSAGKLAAGAKTLADQLHKGADQIPNPDQAAKEKASKVIADPIAVNNVDQAKAVNYGSGLAPFFLVLSLWIGAFMLVQAMRPLTQRALASNAPSWKVALGGWLPFLTVSVIQAIVLYTVVLFGLGLNPSHPVLTLGLLLLASMAFTALIQGIVALLGTPGKLVVLILLVLQLVASGGTFPWQTTPDPLHIMHTILPMGHVVEGMRHLIYGADLAPLLPIALGLVGYTLIGILLSILAVRKRKVWTLSTLQPEISI
ncbi:putative membrane protein [Psychromicrobium silvestre]|uniref:Putative membrane protein n=1 Tax=Psychromicrobium silvestre TaxID=1645614 RepID=A0A7Y9S723_9MICC|nr:YhgE/Pip domain-containing protein [Psychromicrobium silvestre]NYE95809.1 putative membrane protein [Psychromicrobium silvestre]